MWKFIVRGKFLLLYLLSYNFGGKVGWNLFPQVLFNAHFYIFL